MYLDKDLIDRQRKHLESVTKNIWGEGSSASECAHNQCSECIGTGIRRDGRGCVHMISCPCPRCNRSTMRYEPPLHGLWSNHMSWVAA